MNIEAMKIVRENLKTGSILSFAEVMIIQQAIDAAMLQGADGNSPVIPDAYDIEAFGVFIATEGENGLMLQIERFRFGTGKCPQIGKENMVPKFALQAIINRLQEHCDSMGNEALVDILSTPAEPQQDAE